MTAPIELSSPDTKRTSDDTTQTTIDAELEHQPSPMKTDTSNDGQSVVNNGTQSESVIIDSPTLNPTTSTVGTPVNIWARGGTSVTGARVPSNSSISYLSLSTLSPNNEDGIPRYSIPGRRPSGSYTMGNLNNFGSPNGNNTTDILSLNNLHSMNLAHVKRNGNIGVVSGSPSRHYFPQQKRFQYYHAVSPSSPMSMSQFPMESATSPVNNTKYRKPSSSYSFASPDNSNINSNSNSSLNSNINDDPESPHLDPISLSTSPSNYWLNQQTPPPNSGSNSLPQSPIYTPRSNISISTNLNLNLNLNNNINNYSPINTLRNSSPRLKPVSTPIETAPMTPLLLSRTHSHFNTNSNSNSNLHLQNSMYNALQNLTLNNNNNTNSPIINTTSNNNIINNSLITTTTGPVNIQRQTRRGSLNPPSSNLNFNQIIMNIDEVNEELNEDNISNIGFSNDYSFNINNSTNTGKSL